MSYCNCWPPPSFPLLLVRFMHLRFLFANAGIHLRVYKHMLFIIPGRYRTTWTILFSFFPCIVFPGKLWHQCMSAPLLCLSLVCMCPELSMTTSCAGHFPYFRFPALRNNHRSEQACARCPPAMSQNSCAAPPQPHHTHRQSLWMAYQAEMVPPASRGLCLHTSDVEHICKVLKGC